MTDYERKSKLKSSKAVSMNLLQLILDSNLHLLSVPNVNAKDTILRSMAVLQSVDAHPFRTPAHAMLYTQTCPYLSTSSVRMA
jgi:hypothetical protein